MEKIIDILSEIKPGINFETKQDLIDGKVLDSFDIMQIVIELTDEFAITITPSEIVPENFNSAKSLYEMVNRLKDE